MCFQGDQLKNKEDIRVLNRAEYYSSTEYPELVQYAIKQQHSNWLHTDAGVANDLHSILVDISEQERKAIIYVLKLFVHYELRLGSNFWAAIGNTMPRAEVQRMGAVFANMEIAVHSPFYAEVNRLLGLDNPTFYLEYKENPILVDRMKFLEDNCNLGKNATVMEILLTLATLSFIEGVVLYSSFALLKSFQSNGHNEIPNIVTGVDYVVVDEQLHSEGAAALFHILLREADLHFLELQELVEGVTRLAREVEEHEFEIINEIFVGGDLPSISKEGAKDFIRDRSNLVLSYLVEGFSVQVTNSKEVAPWFYKSIGAPILTDFFNRTATEYTRNWNEKDLAWRVHDDNE